MKSIACYCSPTHCSLLFPLLQLTMYHASTPSQPSPDSHPPPAACTPTSSSATPPSAPPGSYLPGGSSSSYLYNTPINPYYGYSPLGVSSSTGPSPAIWSPAMDSRGYGMGTDLRDPRDHSKMYGTDPSKLYGTDTSKIYGTDPSKLYGPDPSKLYGTDPSKLMKTSPQGSLTSSTSSSIPSSPDSFSQQQSPPSLKDFPYHHQGMDGSGSFSHYLGHTPTPGGSYTPLTPLGMMPPSSGPDLGAGGSPGGGWGGYGSGMQHYRSQGE
jgi:hypothetical protein